MVPIILPSEPVAWAAFFASFDDIVLVANSDAVVISEVSRNFGSRALYVFFNKVYHVLREPFENHSILVARSSEAGANIVYRKEVDKVVSLLASPGFRGILNLKAADSERFSASTDFGPRPVGFLDLTAAFAGFYPADHIPSSGFAMTIWLTELNLSARIHLVGFTARRSERWKIFHIHDWTFEQVVQRLLIRDGRLYDDGDGPPRAAIAAITERFPGMAAGDVALVASQVLSERLEGANVAIDRLMSLTKLHRRLDGMFRSLKPKTRKQKLAESRAIEKSPG